MNRFEALMATAAVFGVTVLGAPAVKAEESQFSYVYTTDLLPKGQKEVEQWMTWRHQKVGGTYDEIEGRTEVEYGLSDRLQIAGYVNYAWTQAYHNGPFRQTTPPEQFADVANVGPDSHFKSTRLIGLSGEVIYRVLSPYTDGVGLALYAEPTVGLNFRELETKIILQKNYLDDKLVTAFNFTYAPEWRHMQDSADPSRRTWQEETDVNFNIAASYRYTSNWSAGFELLNEHEYNSYNFTHESNNGFYFGPTLHYGGKSFFVTATLLGQLPWARGHEDSVDGAVVGGRIYDNDFEKYRLRLKAGFYF